MKRLPLDIRIYLASGAGVVVGVLLAFFIATGGN